MEDSNSYFPGPGTTSHFKSLGLYLIVYDTFDKESFKEEYYPGPIVNSTFGNKLLKVIY